MQQHFSTAVRFIKDEREICAIVFAEKHVFPRCFSKVEDTVIRIIEFDKFDNAIAFVFPQTC